MVSGIGVVGMVICRFFILVVLWYNICWDLFIEVFVKNEVFVDKEIVEVFFFILVGIFDDIIVDYMYFVEVFVYIVSICFFIVDIVSVVYYDGVFFIFLEYIFYNWEWFVEGFYIWVDCFFEVVYFVFVVVMYIYYDGFFLWK